MASGFAPLEVYRKARAPCYAIADASHDAQQSRHLELIACRFKSQGLERIAPNAHGRIWLDVVDVWQGVTWDPAIAGDRLGVL
jgi:hypothetical protein